MPLAPKHTRRWFQFSLRTMFVLVTVFGLSGWLGRNAQQAWQRNQLLRELAPLGEVISDTLLGVTLPHAKIPLVWRCFGAAPVAVIFVPNGSVAPNDNLRLRHSLPESEIVFADEAMLLAAMWMDRHPDVKPRSMRTAADDPKVNTNKVQ